MKRLNARLLGLACIVMSAPAHTASLTFSGNIIAVTVDDATGVYASTAVGNTFSSSFTYPDTAGPSTIDEIDEANYELSGSSSLVRGGTTTVSGANIDINIQNNQPLDADTVDFLNDLLMPVPPVIVGQQVDTWTATGLEAGAFEQDPDPSDDDDTELLFDGVSYEFVLLSLDTTLFDSLAYRPLPPGFGDVDFRLFVVREGDAAGNLIFEAYGVISEVTAVPAPPALGLLLTALLALGGRRLTRAPKT